MSAVRVAVPLPAPRALAPARAARLGAFGLLGLWGALRWARLVSPHAAPVLLALAAIAALWAVALDRARAGTRPRGAVALVAALGGAVVLGGFLLVVGVPRPLVLDPRNWGALASGISEGVGGLPNAPTPYDGADEWIRWVTLAGGGLLLGAGGAAVVLLPRRATLRRRAAAALPLLLLAAVPAVVLSDRQGVVQGVPLFALVLLALWLEDLRAGAARGAIVLTVAAAAVGLGAGAAVDAAHPWLRYDRLVLKLGVSRPETFDWNQRYGPLDWVRTGREVLRVQMRSRVYLKAENLDTFDGTGWRAGAVHPAVGERSELPAHPERRWRQSLVVRLRSLGSKQIVGAGTTLGVSRAPDRVVGTGSPGTFDSVSALKPGSSYRVAVYAPTPGGGALEHEPATYPDWSDAYRQITLRGADRHPFTAEFATFGSGLAPLVLDSRGIVHREAAPIDASGYGRAYRLARRLAAGAATPYAFVARVRAYLRSAPFRYSERAPRSARPLETFLFGDHRGYCQQFSGAMALLLRMGGVPARVAAGFTPGEHDTLRDEWVVRDYDAHAWVEAWFPREGWVTFDPTPAAAPALSITLPNLRAGDAPRLSPRSAPARSGTRAGSRGAGAALLPVALAGVPGLLLLAALGSFGRRVARARRQDGIAELEEALRRCGRAPAPTLTLHQLERRLRAADGAGAYVRGLREARYGWPGSRPDPAGRRALRRELSRGLGLAGRVRALWALPPVRRS